MQWHVSHVAWLKLNTPNIVLEKKKKKKSGFLRSFVNLISFYVKIYVGAF